MMRRMILLAFTFFLGVSAMAFAEEQKQQPPNFVFIFADDLGYGDLKSFGGKKIFTPRLDQMAEEGMRFTSFYASAPVCTPSRAGLLTGRLHVRSGMNAVLFPFNKGGLPKEEFTIAELLKAKGYATACIGKWHLGSQEEHLPSHHGFDYFFGLPYSNDMDVAVRKDPLLPLYRNNKIIEQPADKDTLTKRYTEESVKFIREHKDAPFFLYLAHTMPHVPLHVYRDFKDTSERGRYGDAVEEMDWSTGQIFDTLHELKLDKNTLVIFTSDNGPWLMQKMNGGSAGPLRNGKGTCFEGGQRVPMITWWPEHIKAGAEEKGVACTLDILPTFCGLAGITPPADRPLDGTDIAPVLLGTGSRANQQFHYFNANRYIAFRDGKWKLMRPEGTGTATKTPLLFNLEADIGEKNDLVATHPEIVEQMQKAMSEFEKNLGNLPKTVN